MAVDPELRKKFDAIMNRAMGSTPPLSKEDIQKKRQKLQEINRSSINHRLTRDKEYVHGILDGIVADMIPVG